MLQRTQDSTVADAIDRVLQAEHETAAAITAAEEAAAATIATAREKRRSLLETARQRSVRMHERAQALLARRLAELERADATAHAHQADDLASGVTAAIERIAAQLTTETST